MKILLIAGHGAGDNGASGCGYKEANLTRELVKLIASRLGKYADVTIYDTNRNAFKQINSGKSVNFKPYDYVLEVHFNAFNGTAKGTEIYVTTQEKGVSVETAIVNKIAALGFSNRGVKRKNFLVIQTAKNQGVSSALLETCFIDHEKDMATYKANKGKVADAVVDGIVQGFGLKTTTAKKKVQSKAGLDAETMEYLSEYEHAYELFEKLAAAMS